MVVLPFKRHLTTDQVDERRFDREFPGGVGELANLRGFCRCLKFRPLLERAFEVVPHFFGNRFENKYRPGTSDDGLVGRLPSDPQLVIFNYVAVYPSFSWRFTIADILTCCESTLPSDSVTSMRSSSMTCRTVHRR